MFNFFQERRFTKRFYLLTAVFFVLLLAFWFSLPKQLFKSPTSFVVLDRDGKLLSASTASDGQWRFPSSDTIPEKFKKAIVAFEDKRFYFHPGVDPLALARALRVNLQSGRIKSGGSTLSMQVIRLSRKQNRNLWQKLIESILAIRLELGYSKKEILNLYASNAPFGGNVVGLEAASWRYYGRPAADLSWGEMAALAVLPNNPSSVNPSKNQEELRRKRDFLIDKLLAKKILDQQSAALAKLEPLPGVPKPLPQEAPHLLARFRKEFKPISGQNTLLNSTLKANLQIQINAVLDRYHPFNLSNSIRNAAVLVMEVETGEVLAYVGNIYRPENGNLQSHVDVINAPRSPGSLLKPILYASLLSDGAILPHTLIADIPTAISGYTPQNFDLNFDGAVAASAVISRSLNVPSVRMLQTYRTEKIYNLLGRMGTKTLKKPASHYGLSLILGGGESSLWELSGMYASMARTLNNQYDYNGKYNPEEYQAPTYRPKTLKKPIKSQLVSDAPLDAGAIWHTFNAMQEVMRPGEEALWRNFSSSQRIAWKTGTSFGFRDAWAIGLSPKYVVGVWVGNADGEGRPGLTGIQAAAPILFDIFRLLPQGKWFEAPFDKMLEMEVCNQSGHRVSALCNQIDTLWVPKAGLQSKVCNYHQQINVDASGKWRVNDACYPVAAMQQVSFFVLPPAMEWFYKKRNPAYANLPTFLPNCKPEEENQRMLELIYPRDLAKIYIPLELNGERGKVVFEAAHRQSNATIFWHLNDKYLTSTDGIHQIALQAPAGKHTITLLDNQGTKLVHRFEVIY